MSARRALLLVGILCSWAVSLGVAQHSNHYQNDIYDDYNDDRVPSSERGGDQPQPPHIMRPYPVPQQAGTASQDPSVILVPRLGLVRGKIAYKTVGDRRAINGFLGLKYGEVGAGLGRFQRARVVQNNRNGIIDATQTAVNCPQFPDLERIAGAEDRRETVDDCLTLNVHTPNITASLPVMVFVHGEMLFDGGAEEGQPDYLLENDVVLVSVNYRLAPFGFLSTLSDEMPGNVALADIQMALEWVQQHIRPFGGNPDQVTLFGQAGGATLVHALSLSGKAQGLFHKLILQSGTALNPHLLDEDPLMTMRSFARLARCPLNSRDRAHETKILNSCFEGLTTTELLQVFKRHWDENESRGLRFTGGFKLIVGDRFGYLPEHPSALVANNRYPLIAGVAKDAGAFIMSRFYNQLAEVRSRNITDFISVVLKHTVQPRHYALWTNWALQHVFTEQDIRNPALPNLAQGLLELVNLVLYRAPLVDSVRYTSQKNPTYLYVFDYRGEYHRFGAARSPLPFETDATLSDDNIYLFPYPEEVSQLNAADRTMSRYISNIWTNFARFGAPNFSPGVWPNVSSEYGPLVRFTNAQSQMPLELDYHFCDGVPVPNLYPQFFTTTTTARPTTTTTTTTARPYPNYPEYPNQPNYPNYPNFLNYQNHYPNSRNNPYYRAHETVLDDPQQQPQRYPNYPSSNYQMQH